MALVDYGSSGESDEEHENNLCEKENPKNDHQLNKQFTQTSDVAACPVGDVNKGNSLDFLSNPSNDNLISGDLKFRLPIPKTLTTIDCIEEEVNDEFLQKKPIPIINPKPIERIKLKEKVKIIIPSLNELKDDDDKNAMKKKSIQIGPEKFKSCTLLGLLPKPKVGRTLITPQQVKRASASKAATQSKSNPNKDVSENEKSKQIKVKSNSQDSNDDISDSIETDERIESTDFFSLNSSYDLPEENEEKIKEMIAAKVAKIRQTKPQLPASTTTKSDNSANTSEESNPSGGFDEQSVQALFGSNAKRAKHHHNIDIIELSADEVHPDKDQWYRQQIQSSTEYQPRGLVDEEPAAGTRKKHQITYLAHQAKANEQELQAMWATNRQSRRLTQNKYGF